MLLFWKSLTNQLLRIPLWMRFGIGIKRWMVVLMVASMCLGAGIVYVVLWLYQSDIISATTFQQIALSALPDGVRIMLLFVAGVLLLALALWGLGRSLVAPLQVPSGNLAEILVRHHTGRRGPRIVTVGGGTGMPSLLRGLKLYTSNITAIVTVGDDGGSSGRLRRDFGLLPPGDFRNNLAALADDEGLITQLMQYRFGSSVTAAEDSELRGHAFGNLLIAALTGITGSFDEALLAMERVLALRGRVVPSTLDELTLVGEVLVDGKMKRVVGESNIPKVGGQIRRVMAESETLRAYPPAIQAILKADLIVLGPGSLYTSVAPNLLVRDLALAIVHARARVVYVCNVAGQVGETSSYSVSEHVRALEYHLGEGAIDVVLANDHQPEPPVGRAIDYVAVDVWPSTTIQPADLIDTERPWRHDSAKVAKAVMRLLDNNSTI